MFFFLERRFLRYMHVSEQDRLPTYENEIESPNRKRQRLSNNADNEAGVAASAPSRAGTSENTAVRMFIDKVTNNYGTFFLHGGVTLCFLIL